MRLALSIRVPRPHHDQPQVRPVPLQLAVRQQQVLQPLPLVRPTEKQQIYHPVLQVRERLHALLILVDPDPVGNNLILALEVTADVFLGRLRNGDASVQLLEVGLSYPRSAHVIDPRAGVGVKRRDVHCLRLAQHPHAHVARKRLVHVDDVELLLVQHLLDLPAQPHRHRYPPDRTPARQRERFAHGDESLITDLAHVRARRDDAYVVAPCP